MRIVIAGGGRGGLAVGKHLAQASHDVMLVDLDPRSARVAEDAFGLVSMAGDATDPRVFSEAIGPGADVVVSMLPRDADNLAVALLARREGVGRVMVRVKDDAYRRVFLDAGIHRLMSEREVLVGAFAATIEHGEVLASMWLAGGEGLAFELVLPRGSLLAEKTVGEIASMPGFPESCVFGGLRAPGERISAPRGGSVVRPGSTLLLIAQHDDLERVVEFFTNNRFTPKEKKKEPNT